MKIVITQAEYDKIFNGIDVVNSEMKKHIAPGMIETFAFIKEFIKKNGWRGLDKHMTIEVHNGIETTTFRPSLFIKLILDLIDL